MTVTPPSRPLPPVLGRMAIGLLVAGAGGVVAWQSVGFSPTPGMAALSTPLSVPLRGVPPQGLPGAASVHLRGDRVDLNVTPLDTASPWLFQGSALHRGRNPVVIDLRRDDETLSAAVSLSVRGFDRGGVIVGEPEPLQHRVSVALTRRLPLSLSTRTGSGDQALDLTPLRLRALNLRTGSGAQAVTLPDRPAGPFSLVSGSGNIAVRAGGRSSPEALRVNTQSGDLSLSLATARTLALGAGSVSGDVQLTLPESFARGTVTTASGDVTVTAPATLTGGNLDIRTQSGAVVLSVAPQLRVRVRFTDRDTVVLPEGTPPGTAPQLDVFIDSGSGDVRLERPDGTDVPLPAASVPAAPPIQASSLQESP
ncbi:DUF4097 family beta strand repeat-containing protein [Deinococcus yunweiensis]|uniref:DUF4097 family beta strand repeat-containing protein n=1 Tax=Deinococcus yunweiensis TaxID=367282 RepID=UPI00398EFE7B